MKASDGDGVQLTRIIASPELDMIDPFLLMDAFGSNKPQDYIGGFPPHPHRGFETVTYMLAGKMRHKDSAGNEGVIEAGGVQEKASFIQKCQNKKRAYSQAFSYG